MIGNGKIFNPFLLCNLFFNKVLLLDGVVVNPNLDVL